MEVQAAALLEQLAVKNCMKRVRKPHWISRELRISFPSLMIYLLGNYIISHSRLHGSEHAAFPAPAVVTLAGRLHSELLDPPGG
jgi:hypothetical protein